MDAKRIIIKSCQPLELGYALKKKLKIEFSRKSSDMFVLIEERYAFFSGAYMVHVITGIAREQRVYLDFISGGGEIFNWGSSGLYYKKLVKAVREFCEESGAVFMEAGAC